MLELFPRLEEWKRNGKSRDSTLVRAYRFVYFLFLLVGDYRPEEHARIVGRDGRMSAAGVNTAEISNGLDLLQDEIRKRLQSLLRTRILRGFPINIPFTDVDEIITQVSLLLFLCWFSVLYFFRCFSTAD
jgi:hypothetical protein